MRKFILVNQIKQDTYDVILPNGAIYITLLREFASWQECEEYIRDRVGLSFERMHVLYELTGKELSAAIANG